MRRVVINRNPRDIQPLSAASRRRRDCPTNVESDVNLRERQPVKAEAFLSHLEPIQRVLEVYCRRSLRDGNEVSDVLQSAVANAFRDFHEFAEGTNFRAWMFRYVALEVLNRNRAAGKTQPMGGLEDVPGATESGWFSCDADLVDIVLRSPERILESCDDAIKEAVEAMPDKERSVFLLRAIGDFQYREIAEILDMPMGTVMGLLSRGRGRLRERLAEPARMGRRPGPENEEQGP